MQQDCNQIVTISLLQLQKLLLGYKHYCVWKLSNICKRKSIGRKSKNMKTFEFKLANQLKELEKEESDEKQHTTNFLKKNSPLRLTLWCNTKNR